MYIRDYQVESFDTGFKIVTIYVAAYNEFGVVCMKGVKYHFQLAQKEFKVTTQSSINTNNSDFSLLDIKLYRGYFFVLFFVMFQ
jgi:hypothetical protein